MIHKFEACLYYPQYYLPTPLKEVYPKPHVLILRHFFVKLMHSINSNVYKLYIKHILHIFFCNLLFPFNIMFERFIHLDKYSSSPFIYISA